MSNSSTTWWRWRWNPPPLYGSLRHLGRDVPELSRSLCHIIASGMFSGLFEIVVHDMPREQAQRDVEQFRQFYTGGWLKLMGDDPCLFWILVSYC